MDTEIKYFKSIKLPNFLYKVEIGKSCTIIQKFLEVAQIIKAPVDSYFYNDALNPQKSSEITQPCFDEFMQLIKEEIGID